MPMLYLCLPLVEVVGYLDGRLAMEAGVGLEEEAAGFLEGVAVGEVAPAPWLLVPGRRRPVVDGSIPGQGRPSQCL